jgi:prepilin-type N-terminal cleavage/methylation domain-containing protein
MRFKDKIQKNIFILSFLHRMSSLRMRGSMDSPLQGNDRGGGCNSWESNDRNRAFSLVELMVTVSIFAIISGVVIYDYGKFSSNLVVTNLAYEAALAVREAQVYGISVKKTLSEGTFDSSYGVWFDLSDPALAQTFYLFADNTKNNLRDDNTENEEVFGMNGSNIIKNFCVTKSGDPLPICSGGDQNQLSIMFTRPNPEAKIHIFKDDVEVGVGISFTKAEIMFTSGRGDKTARMTVTNTGQISVDSCPTDPAATNKCQ